MGTTNTAPETPKKVERKISVTYTLQRLKATIKTLVEAKMITELEKQQLVEFYNTLKNREIGEDLKL